MVKKPPMILYIEDDPAHAEIIKRSFRKCTRNGTITHLEDGQQALDYLFRRGEYSDPDSSPRPDLILTDLRLPKVDGIELIGKVREDESLSTVPIVVLSTSDSENDIAAVYNSKANSYLVKPMECSQFLDLIDTMGNYWLGYNRYPEL